MKRGGRLPARSDKREAERDEYHELKVAALARDRGCRARMIVPEVRCIGRYDLDHVKSRGRGGARLSLENVVILCRNHHDWKDAHPDDANARGLWPHSWEDPPPQPEPWPSARDFWDDPPKHPTGVS